MIGSPCLLLGHQRLAQPPDAPRKGRDAFPISFAAREKRRKRQNKAPSGLRKTNATLAGRIARKAGPAAVLAGDAELNGRMERLAALLDANDDAMAEYEVLGLLLGLQRRDLSTTKPRFLLTRAQMGMAAAARDEMERALSARHDARTMAAAFGVSATSPNEYFTRAYGSTIATYLRRRRMEEAATQLAQGAKVTEAATYVGYANPSKFAAAFKKAYGVPPREWKHASGMGLRSV